MEYMQKTNKQDGNYATIYQCSNGTFYASSYEVFANRVWNIGGITDTSIQGIHHYLNGHGIKKQNITLSKKELINT